VSRIVQQPYAVKPPGNRNIKLIEKIIENIAKIVRKTSNLLSYFSMVASITLGAHFIEVLL